MAISILGGSLKGLKLKVGDSSLMRPTSVMLRRKLFDSLQDLSGYLFLDICAGSGAVGLEALSRGAKHSFFIEKKHRSYRVLRENIDQAIMRDNSLAERFSVIKKDFAHFKEILTLSTEPTILFFDPPYKESKMYEKFFQTSWPDHIEQVWVEMDKKHLDIFNSKVSEFKHKIYQHSDNFVCKLFLK